MGIITSIVNPKGGEGKTTLTAIIATIIHVYFPDLKVACIDIDYLQQNLLELRNIDLYHAEKVEYYGRLKEKYGIYPIEVADTDAALEKINKMKNEYDVVFVDAPGTLMDEKLTSILLSMNYFIVPLYPDNLGMDTTLKFLKILQALEKIDSAQIKGKAVLFNLYSKIYERSAGNSKFDYAKEIIEGMGVQVFKNKVYKRIEIEEKRSTIYPLPYREDDNSSVYNVVQEIMKFLNLIN